MPSIFACRTGSSQRPDGGAKWSTIAPSSQRPDGGAKWSTIAPPSFSSHDTGTRAAATAATAGMPT